MTQHSITQQYTESKYKINNNSYLKVLQKCFRAAWWKEERLPIFSKSMGSLFQMKQMHTK